MVENNCDEKCECEPTVNYDLKEALKLIVLRGTVESGGFITMRDPF